MCETERLTRKLIIIFTFNILFSILYFHSLNSFLHFLHHHYKRRHRNQFAFASNDWDFNTSKLKKMIQDDETMIQKRRTLKDYEFWQRNNIYFSIHWNFRKLNQQWQVAFRQKLDWSRRVEYPIRIEYSIRVLTIRIQFLNSKSRVEFKSWNRRVESNSNLETENRFEESSRNRQESGLRN